jgi:hypothetical protein
MGQMLMYGFIGGIVFYFVKLISFFILTQPKWMRWLRTLAHGNSLGLFILDIVAGTIISSTIKMVGAEGLTVLFFFTGFSLMSMLYIMCHIGCTWVKGRMPCGLGHS